MTQVPGRVEKLRPYVDRQVVAAGVLDAAQVQDLGPARGHLQHLLGRDGGDAAGGRHDPRVGGEHAVDVGVDLADLGAQRRGQRDRGGVGAPAAERGDVLALLGDALEAGDDRDRALRQRLLDPAGRDVDDLGLAVHRVGDHAGLRPGERLRLVAEVADRHRQHRHRDPLAGGEQHVQLAAAAAAARPRGPGRAARRWCRPSPTPRRRRRGPALRVATMRCATRLMPVASATEEPPYFWTTMPTAFGSIDALGRHPVESACWTPDAG